MELSEILKLAVDLPSYPVVSLKVARETDNSEATASSIADLMAQDTGLSVRVLRLANSSFFGIPRQVDSLREAIVMLGLANVRRLALAASTYAWFHGVGGRTDLPSVFWSQSISVASFAQVVASEAKSRCEVDPFTAALLVDVGLTALGAVLPDHLDVILRACSEEGRSLTEVETEQFGFTHQELGAQLGDYWGFPEVINQVILHHHDPNRADERLVITDCIHVAQVLCSRWSLGLAKLGVQHPLQPEVLDRLQIAEAALDDLARAGAEQIGERESMMSGILAA